MTPRARAEELVMGNRERYPELLVEQMATAFQDAARCAGEAAYCRELTTVALRMLKRDGRLKPTTDDERAAVELAGYMLDVPAANRRLLHPMTEPYSQIAVNTGQQILDLGEAA